MMMRCPLARAREILKSLCSGLALCAILFGSISASAAKPPVILASEAGAHLDTDLRVGGGRDDTRALQKILDRARSGRPVHLIVDGPALITGLEVHSGTVIECLPGAGFFLRSHSDRAMIRNANRSRERIGDRHIRIEGCFFNGNRQGQVAKAGPFVTQGDATVERYSDRQEADGTFKSILQFFGVESIELERLTLFNGRAFGVWFGNARRISIRDIEVDSNFPSLSPHPSVEEVRVFNEKHRSNGDGLHFSGPIEYLTVDGVRLRTDDDGISLTANDMGVDDITIANDMGPYVGQGPVSDVSIRNVVLMDSIVGIRLLSTTQRIDRVHIENVSGIVRGRGVSLGPWANRLNSPHRGDLGAISFANVSLSPAHYYTWRELWPSIYSQEPKTNWDFGEEADIPVFSINAPVEHLNLSDVYVQAIDDRPIVRFGRDAKVRAARIELSIDDARGLSVPIHIYQGHVHHLRLDLDWHRPSMAPERSPIKIEGGRIGTIVGDVSTADDFTQPLRVSPNGHFLAAPDGTPFFWLADTAWDLFQRLEREEVEDYFKDRAAKGFTVIQAVIGGGGAHQGPNRYGQEPFVGKDPARPNEAYFAHVDWVVERAGHYGLRMAVIPYWAGAYHVRSGLAGEHFEPRGADFNTANARIYGNWLGQRYRDRGISWVFGGDANPLWPQFIAYRKAANGKVLRSPEHSDMSTRDRRPVYDAMAAGLAEGEGRAPFITYHPNCCTFPGMPKPLTSVMFADRPWLTMNMIQSSHYENPPEQVHGELIGFSFGWLGPKNYEPILHEFMSKPSRPVIDGEPRYEDLGKDNDAPNVATKGYWTGDDARQAAYQAVFAGAAGHTYGNHAIWQFAGAGKYTGDPPIQPGLTWREALQRPVSGQLRHLKALMLSRPYFSRVPDQSLIVGEPGEGKMHIAATRDQSGSYAMVYLPQGQSVTIDLNSISGSRVTGWWFDPRSGAASRIEQTFANKTRTSFTPPSSGMQNDWVLVLDDAGKGFPAPGQQ